MSRIEAYCRLCGKVSKKTMQLTSSHRRQMLACFGIQALPSDGLPQVLCFKCQVIMTEFHSIMVKYQNEQVVLYNQFKKKMVTKEEIISKQKLQIEKESHSENRPKSNKSSNSVDTELIENAVDVRHDEPMEVDNTEILNSSLKELTHNSVKDIVILESAKEIDSNEVNVNVETNIEKTILKITEDKVEESISKTTSNSNDSENIKTIVPIWKFRYNCSLCRKCFHSNNQLQKHINVMHKNLVYISNRFCNKICLVTISKLPIILPNKVGFPLSPSWVHLSKRRIRKVDLNIKYCFISKVQYNVNDLENDTISKCVALDKKNSNSVTIASPTKNSIDLTIENVALHNTMNKNNGNKNRLNTTDDKLDVDDFESSIVEVENILSHTNEKLKNSSLLNKEQYNDAAQADVTGNIFSLKHTEIYKTVLKTFTEYKTNKKTDFNTIFMNRIKLKSINLLWKMNETAPFNLSFSNSLDLHRHSIKKNGLCANMIGLKPYFNKIQSQIPICQSMLNVKYFKFSDEEKSRLKLNTKEPPIISEPFQTPETTDSSLHAPVLLPKSPTLPQNQLQTGSEYSNSLIPPLFNDVMPKIISTFTLSGKNSNKKTIKITKIRQPLIKCKPTALLMPDSSSSIVSNAISDIPNTSFSNSPMTLSCQQSNDARTNPPYCDKNVILNYHYNQNNTEPKQFTIKKKSNNLVSDSISSNVNKNPNISPNILLDINLNSHGDFSSNILTASSLSMSEYLNPPLLNTTLQEKDNMVDYENLIVSPVILKKTNNNQFENNVSRPSLPVYVSISNNTAPVIVNKSVDSQNLLPITANNQIFSMHDTGISCFSKPKSLSDSMRISTNSKNQNVIIQPENYNFYQYQFCNSQTEPSSLITQPSLIIGPQSQFVPQSSQLISQSSELVSQPPQFVSQPPQFVSQQQQFISQQPEFVSQQPQFVSQQQQFISQQPQFVSQQPQFVSQQPQFVSQPSQLSSQPSQLSSQPTQFAISPSQLANQLSQPGTDVAQNRKGPLFALIRKIRERGGNLFIFTKEKTAFRSLVRFKILINEMYRENSLSKTFHVKLSLLQHGSFLLNIANSEHIDENINEWSCQYQNQLIRAFQQRAVLDTISLMASTNQFNIPKKTQLFLQTMAEFDLTSWLVK